MSDKPEIPERWQDRWARLGEVYAAFEKQERESGKLWSDIPNPTQYVLDRMEAAEARVRELEQALEKYGGHCAEEGCMGVPCTCGLSVWLHVADKAAKP